MWTAIVFVVVEAEGCSEGGMKAGGSQRSSSNLYVWDGEVMYAFSVWQHKDTDVAHVPGLQSTEGFCIQSATIRFLWWMWLTDLSGLCQWPRPLLSGHVSCKRASRVSVYTSSSQFMVLFSELVCFCSWCVAPMHDGSILFIISNLDWGFVSLLHQTSD